jgi:predicted permease
MRHPGFALTAVLALALGIGANTAVFSVVYAVLIKPLPYPDPDALVNVHDTYPAVSSASVSFPKFVALRDKTRTLTALGAVTRSGLTLTGSAEPEQVAAATVSADFFTALGVTPILGRSFTAEEDLPNGPKTIVLVESLWRRRFGGDPRIIGRAIQVNGLDRTIVGVMPNDAYPTGVQAWVPLELALGTTGGGNFLRLLGRMRPGVTLEQVQQDLGGITAEFNKQNGVQRDVRVWSLHELTVTGNRRTLLVLQGIVAFVLLIACANVANLLLARSVTRQRELAIRAAIGAGRGRLVRQLLTESVMLSLVGGVLGVLLASWLLRLFLAVVPASFPRVGAIALDTGVLAFTIVVAVLTGLIFGLAPARQGFKTDPNDSLRDTGARGATAGGTRGASRALVVAEVALALVLVVGAGLMVKSLLRLQGESTGFSADGLFTFNLNLPPAKYPKTAPREFYRRLLEELKAVPGVQSASAINYAPMTDFGFNGPFTIEGRPPFDPATAPVTEYRFISPGYFETMGIPIVRGQDFTRRHDETDRPVVIVNETMVRKHFGDMNPIGARIWLATDPRTVIREVVGVVADVRDAALGASVVEEAFVPHAQGPLGAMAIMVRTSGDMRMETVLPSIRRRIAGLDPDLPIVRPQTMQAAMDATAGTTRMTSVLSSVFALVAAMLASVGIYSLIAYSVAQRTREIGIRMALGADRRAVLRLVIGEGLLLAAIGIALGIPGSFLVTRALDTLLYEVKPGDPFVLASTCAGVLAVAMLASVVPAIRAVRVDPMNALRMD